MYNTCGKNQSKTGVSRYSAQFYIQFSCYSFESNLRFGHIWYFVSRSCDKIGLTELTMSYAFFVRILVLLEFIRTRNDRKKKKTKFNAL